MTLGEKIQILRKQRGLSQERLAEMMLVRRQAVSKWELLESLPDVENIVRLSEIFGVTTDYLLKCNDEVGDKPPKEGVYIKEGVKMKEEHIFKRGMQSHIFIGAVGLLASGLGLIPRIQANLLFPIAGVALLVGLFIAFILPLLDMHRGLNRVKLHLGSTLTGFGIFTIILTGLTFNRLHALMIMDFAGIIAWLGLAISIFIVIKHVARHYKRGRVHPVHETDELAGLLGREMKNNL